MLFYRLDGAYSRVDEEATAFSGGRSQGSRVFVIGVLPGTRDARRRARVGARAVAEALAPLYADDGVYVNGMTDFDARTPVRTAYGPEKYARLGDIKTKYDPDNVFHCNANIAPAAAV